MLLGGFGAVRAADAPAGITDGEIHDVITRVARNQMHPLADGDDAAVKSIDEAKAARMPEGISWSYPWGVALFALSRSTDVTGDQDVDKFVARHNLICARYYK